MCDNLNQMIPSFRDVGIILNIDGSEDKIDRIELKMIVTFIRFNENFEKSVLTKSLLAKDALYMFQM